MEMQIDVELLKRAGHQFVVLEGTKLLFPELVGRHGLESSNCEIILLQTASHLEEIVARMSDNDWVLFWGGCFDSQIDMIGSPYSIIARGSARLGAINAFHLPSHEFGFMSKILFKLRYEVASLPRIARRKTAKLNPKHRRNCAHSHEIAKLRPLDFVWAGTSTLSLSNKIMDSETIVRYIHSLDAELIRKLPRSQRIDKPFILFLDSMGPLHPDLLISGSAFKTPVSRYFSATIEALNRVSDATGLSIFVAAHPRAMPGSLDTYYHPYPVHYFSTPHLIQKSTGVIDLACSAAIGMAALLRKPVIFLDDKTVTTRRINYLQKCFAAELGVPIIRVAEFPKSYSFDPEVGSGYDIFVRKYISPHGWPEIDFWQTVVQDIQTSRFAQ